MVEEMSNLQDGEETVVETQTPQVNKEQELEARLRRAEVTASESSTLAQLVADPDIRAVLEARQRNEKIRVIRGEEMQKFETPVAKEPEDLDSLSPAKLVEYMLGKMNQIVEEKVTTKMEPVSQRVQMVQAKYDEEIRQAAATQVQQARKKYTDFDVLALDITKLAQESPTLSVDELYTVAKIRRGGMPLSQTEVGSERPSSSSSVRTATRKEPLPRGNRGFSLALGEALSKIKLPAEFNLEGE